MQGLSFQLAYKELRNGNRICRNSQQGVQYGWNPGLDSLQVDRQLSQTTGLLEGSRVIQQPFVMRIESVQGGIALSPYQFTNQDMAAEDWAVATGVVTTAERAGTARSGD